MKITFTSLIIDAQKKESRFHFSAPLVIGKWNEFVVYEFVEPSNQELNRIEVSQDAVNIIAGPNTINLELEKDIDVLYKTNVGEIIFTSRLNKLKMQEDEVEFNYSLSDHGNEIGNYTIKLNIEK